MVTWITSTGVVRMGRPINPLEIVRIEMLDAPLEREPGEGLYEWRTPNNQDGFTVDMLTLEKQIEQIPVFKGHGERILDRLQNFRVVYLNIATGEVGT